MSLVLVAGLPAAAYCAVPEQKAESAGESIRQAEKKKQIPWISCYYIRPDVRTEEAVKIGFYVTDWSQSEYRLQDNRHRFNAVLKIRKKEARNVLSDKELVLEKKNIGAGDHLFEAGNFPEGEYQLELSAEDMQGRKSAVLFHEFRVKKDFGIPEKETFRPAENDLAQYGISNKGDLGIFHFIDAKGLDKEKTAALVEAEAKKVKVPSGKYVVVAGAEKYDPAENRNHRGARNCPEPEWLPNSWSWQSCKVLYADDYNREKAEADAVATGNGLNKLLLDAKEKGFRKVVLLPGTYRISSTTTINIPSGITLDLNGATIKLNQHAGHKGLQINIRDGYDSHVVNGIVEGDYFEHDYKNSTHNSEWVCGIGMDGEAKYSSFERILVRYITGYGVTHGFHGNYGKHIPVKSFEYGYIDDTTGELKTDIPGLAVSNPVNVSAYLNDCGYLAASRLLGYQGMVGGSDWSLRFHFYDKDGKYLETIYGRQYRRVRIPSSAETVRITMYIAKDLPKSGNMWVNLFRVPWNSWYSDLFILSARCVGMAPNAMYNFKVENCSFVRSGENSAKCAFDAEDGWDMMQDVWYVRNKFFKNPINEFLCCAGHNFIVEDNECRFYLWNRTNAYVVRNNEFSSATYGAGATRARTGLVRVYDNTYSGSVYIGDRPAAAKNGGDLAAAADDALAAVDPSQWEKGVKRVGGGTPWFITIKDADNAAAVECGDNAVLSGVTVTDKKAGVVSLLNSTMKGSKDMRLGGSKILRSELADFSGFVSGEGILSVSESKLRNGSVNLQNGSVVIRNSHLKNIAFLAGYWIAPVKVIFENCTIENAEKPLVRTGVYSIGEFRFVNCKINTGKAPVIEVYDMRQNNNGKGKDYEAMTGTVRFENCTIENQKKSVIVTERDSGSRKKIILIDKANQCAFDFMQNKPAWWDLQK